jgi:hypothetical protein
LVCSAATILSNDGKPVVGQVSSPLTYPYVWPVSGLYQNLGVTSAHDGYDTNGGFVGTPVVAAFSGYVDAGAPQGCVSGGANPGRYVRIDHRNSGDLVGTHKSRYHHLSSVAPGVAVGAWVATGQVIGYQGSSGNACYPHLHFEFRDQTQGNQPINFNGELSGDISATAMSPLTFSGQWHLNNGPDGVSEKFVYFGRRGDVPISGDWDGNGREELGVVRHNPGTGAYDWYTSSANLSTVASGTSLAGVLAYAGYGQTPDVPLAGDWDGNATDRPGVVRPNGSSFRWLLANTWGPASIDSTWGGFCAGFCIPIVGDWDGNGSHTRGYFRVADKTWTLNSSNTGGTAWSTYALGRNTDLPLVGDHAGPDRSALWRSVDGSPPAWFRAYAFPGTVSSFSWATTNDFPLVVDWDSDPNDEYVIVR